MLYVSVVVHFYRYRAWLISTPACRRSSITCACFSGVKCVLSRVPWQSRLTHHAASHARVTPVILPYRSVRSEPPKPPGNSVPRRRPGGAPHEIPPTMPPARSLPHPPSLVP